MNIMSVCTKNDINNLVGIVKIINYIKVIIPICIIIFTIIKLLRCNELNKSLIKLFIINMIISILIFILPNLIYLLNNFINIDKLVCMGKIDKNVINVIDILNKDNKTKSDYDDVYNYYLKIENEDIKKELLNDVENLKYIGNDNIDINIKSLIESYKESFDINVYNEIIKLYEIMEKNDINNNIEIEINNLKKYNNIIESINLLKDNYDKTKYNEIVNNINNLEDEKIKDKLNNKLSDLRLIKKLDVTSGINTFNEGNFGYVIAIPENPIEEMPLIVGLNGLSASMIYEKIMPQVQTKFIYIEAHTSAATMWQDDNALNKVINLINDSINKYKINKDKIVIVGYSIGAMGVWEIVSKNPNFFSDAIIVSCNGPYFRANSFINTRVFAYSGDTGDDETGYAFKMQNYVKQINDLGGKAYYTQSKNTTHRGSGATLIDPAVYKKVFDE